jgi:carboxymethylenebutenolidase
MRYLASHERIQYSVRGKQVDGCLFRPQITLPQPAIVVLHEWWGVNTQMLGVAERYAHVGYVTLAVDLYRGKVTSDAVEARQWSSALTLEDAEENLRAAVRWLRAQPFVKDGSVGSVGFCLGGRYALLLTTGDDHTQAAVSFYGRTELMLSRLAAVRAPMLGLYGARDASIPVTMVEQLRDALNAMSKFNEFIIYPDAGHGFFNEQSSAFRFAEAEDAWSRSNKFFYQHLGEPS